MSAINPERLRAVVEELAEDLGVDRPTLNKTRAEALQLLRAMLEARPVFLASRMGRAWAECEPEEADGWVIERAEGP